MKILENKITVFIAATILLSIIPAVILWVTTPFKPTNNLRTEILVIGTLIYTLINLQFQLGSYVEKNQDSYEKFTSLGQLKDIWDLYKAALTATIAFVVVMVLWSPLHEDYLFAEYLVRPWGASVIVIFVTTLLYPLFYSPKKH